MIAIALSCKPRLLIADEPTTALDVTVQAGILDLLEELREQYEMSMIIITHDMGVVAEAADEIAVMYAGQIVEQSSAEELFDHPEHPYTEALLGALPQLEGEGVRQSRLTAIPGRPPDLRRPARRVPLRAALPVREPERRVRESTCRSCARSGRAISCGARTRRASAPAASRERRRERRAAAHRHGSAEVVPGAARGC